MVKKVILLTAVSSLFSVLLVDAANNNQKAIDYLKFDLKNPAKTVLLQNIKDSQVSAQQQAEADYYLGEIYFIEQKKDSADFYFKKGEKADQTYAFNTVGEAKLLLKTNPSEAEKLLSQALSGKNKKDMTLQVAVARAYLDNNLVDKATKQVEDAQKINEKSAPLFVLQGDLLALKQDYGNACNSYEQAIYFDAKCKEAYIKYARVYIKINPTAAIDKLQQLANLDPTSSLAYREIGEVYYQNGQFTSAATAYAKYIETEQYSLDDYPKYASILFFNGDFSKSKEIAQKATNSDPNNFVLNRLLMYNSYELKQFSEGIVIGDKFIKMINSQEFISLDYIYYARLLSENNRKEEAIVQYQKAITLDSSKIALYKELGSVYESLNQYDKAIPNYSAFIKKSGSDAKIADYFLLGKCNYYAATSLAPGKENDDKKNQYCHVADSLFGYVAQKAPDNYLGNFWRARVNAILDPETENGLAKPYYEATIPLLNKDNAKDVKTIIECYSYLGYYFYVKKDFPTSKDFWNKILAIDPENETALKALKGIK
jgi:predicted Zn-dependent protease